MEGEFVKYRINKKRWWHTGKFRFIDEDGKIVYKIERSVWQTKFNGKLLDQNDNLLMELVSTNMWNNEINILKDNQVIAFVSKKMGFTKERLHVVANQFPDLIVLSEKWGQAYKFYEEDEEVAMVSYKMWSSGEFGLALKKSNSQELIVALAAIIVIFKQSNAI